MKEKYWLPSLPIYQNDTWMMFTISVLRLTMISALQIVPFLKRLVQAGSTATSSQQTLHKVHKRKYLLKKM